MEARGDLGRRHEDCEGLIWEGFVELECCGEGVGEEGRVAEGVEGRHLLVKMGETWEWRLGWASLE